MNRPRKPSARDIRRHVSEVGPEDGLDPRYDRDDTSGEVPNRKALQLCAQVGRTLSAVLAGEADDLLRDLLVASVVPAPNAGRLLVTVYPSTLPDADPAEVLQRLFAAHGRLRGEVAGAIHRRKTPELVFQVAGPPRR